MLVDKYGIGRLLESNGNFIKKAISKIFGWVADGETTEFANSLVDYMVVATNSNYEQDIQRHLAENPTWSYEQAEKRALIDAALQIAEADIGELSSLMFTAKAKK